MPRIVTPSFVHMKDVRNVPDKVANALSMVAAFGVKLRDV